MGFRLAVGCWKSQIMINEVESFVLQQLDYGASLIHWCSVLLNHKTVNHTVFDSSQRLLRQ